jgi:hypothetical protein
MTSQNSFVNTPAKMYAKKNYQKFTTQKNEQSGSEIELGPPRQKFKQQDDQVQFLAHLVFLKAHYKNYTIKKSYPKFQLQKSLTQEYSTKKLYPKFQLQKSLIQIYTIKKS